MLTDAGLEQILTRLPDLTIGVLGDLFLDRYLELDARLTETSLETGLDAYQVVQVRASPGAAGTIVNNLAALGVGRIPIVSLVGDDGEGYELGQALGKLPGVESQHIHTSQTRRTPTYTKPLLIESDRPPRELNRLDIKNRVPLDACEQERVLHSLDEVWPGLDALLVLDQVSEADCGVVTTSVRSRLAKLGDSQPDRLILADSRCRIGEFRAVTIKPNRTECLAALKASDNSPSALARGAWNLARLAGRTVFCTLGEQGMWLVEPSEQPTPPVHVPAYPVSGPVDIVGAGDSSSAGIACAISAGVSKIEAAAFGNLIASITIQQIGTTGVATPAQALERWNSVRGGHGFRAQR